MEAISVLPCRILLLLREKAGYLPDCAEVIPVLYFKEGGGLGGGLTHLHSVSRENTNFTASKLKLIWQ